MTPFSIRTMWMSDLHLGNKDCKASYLFLHRFTGNPTEIRHGSRLINQEDDYV